MDYSPITPSVIFMFSAGKDSIAAADIFIKNYSGKIHWAYLYFVEGLSFVDRIISHYERRWNIEVHQRPCHETLSIIAHRNPKNRKKNFTPGYVEAELKKEFDCEWIVDGMKRNDSLARRGMLKDVVGTVDYEAKKIHPIIDWKDSRVSAYLKLSKLPVPITYSFGPRRSVWTITSTMMPWLKENFPSDYELVLREIPELGDSIFRKELS
jgi:3'-phosphoadenosine 5'-phosphosulfate sulfotransferase (PAPS reductase)/FAD synthetase